MMAIVVRMIEMNSSKIGKFIKEKRKERDLTQNDLAEHLLTSRENISKWERGLAIPNTEYLKPLCEKLEISVTELLAAKQDEMEEQEVVYELLYKKDKYRKVIQYISMLLFITVFCFLGYFFITNYKSLKIYLITAETDSIHLHNSILVVSKDKIYLTLNSEENIDSAKIYFEDNKEKYVIFETKESKTVIIDYISYNEYINKSNIDDIIDKLYIEYTINNEIKTSKLKISKDYENALIKEELQTDNPVLELEPTTKEITPQTENDTLVIKDNQDTWVIYGNEKNYIKYNSDFSYNTKTNQCFFGICNEEKINSFLKKYYKNGEWNE